jgi:threonine-phosphate decarboxylase
LEPDFPSKVEHGGLIKKYLEETGKQAIDFSASLNPFIPPLKWEFPPCVLDHYPDDSYSMLKKTIGNIFNRTPDEIAVGNGSIELIRTFCQVIFRNGGGALIDTPTFSEYLLSTELAGGHRVKGKEVAAVAFICNPNNPTGVLRKKAELADLVHKHTRNGTYVFLDEAFIELADPEQSLVDFRDPRLLILRSLTKCFAVPGLRFGYAIGDPSLISRLEIARPPWSVNAFAEHFALQAFSHYHELAASREKIREERDILVKALEEFRFSVTPPSANFILVDTGMSAGNFSRSLLEYGFLVRDCTSFGLPTSIRIAVRGHDDNIRLIEAIRKCVQ